MKTIPVMRKAKIRMASEAYTVGSHDTQQMHVLTATSGDHGFLHIGGFSLDGLVLEDQRHHTRFEQTWLEWTHMFEADKTLFSTNE